MKGFLKRNRTEILLYASFVLIHLLLMQASHMPLMYGDERGYIGWARRIWYGTSDGVRYLPGYSLFLVPVLAVCNDITKAYPWILAVNGLIGGIIPVAIYRISGFFGELPEKRRILCAAVCSLYPAYLLYANMALCEILLATLFVLFIWQCGALALNSSRTAGWIRLGLIGLGMTAVHARGAVILPAIFLCLPVLAGRENRKKVLWGMGSLLLVTIFLGAFFLMGSSVNAVHIREQLAGLLTSRGIKDFCYALLSQAGYLLFSGYFLAAVGIWFGVRIIRKRERGWQCAWCILVCCGALFAISALFMSHHQKPVHILYGRYNDCMMSGLLLLGTLGLLTQKRVPRWLILPCFFVIGITGWKQAPLLAGGQRGAELARIASGSVDSEVAQVFGIGLYRAVLEGFDYWQAALLFCCLTAVAAILFRKRNTAGLLLICVLFAVNICYTDVTYFARWSASRNTESEVLRVLEGNEQIKVVEQEENGLGYAWDYDKYMTVCPELEISVDEKGQSILVTRQNNYSLPLLAAEQDVNIYLWARNQQAAEQYQQWIMGEGEEAVSLSLSQQGEAILINGGAALMCYDAAKNIRKSVAVLAAWYGEDGSILQIDRLELPRNLYRGDRAAWQLTAPEAASRVYLAAAVEYDHWLPGGGMYEIENEKGRILSVSGSDQKPEKALLSFGWVEMSHMKEEPVLQNTSWNSNLTGFFGTMAGQESTISNISCPAKPGDTLAVYASQGGELEAEVNGISVGSARWQDGCYRFALNGGPVTQVTLRYKQAGRWRQSNWKLLNRWYQSRYQGIEIVRLEIEEDSE